MSKMTKAAARRRLMEAQSKLMRVDAAAYMGSFELTSKEHNEIVAMMRTISRLHNKLK